MSSNAVFLTSLVTHHRHPSPSLTRIVLVRTAFHMILVIRCIEQSVHCIDYTIICKHQIILHI